MSSDVGELKKLVKELQSGSTPSTIRDILQNLKKNFVVNESLLRESKAGLAVGKLRTHSDRSVSEAAKELVLKWKSEVAKKKDQGGGVAAATPTPVRKASLSSNGPPTPTTPTTTTIAAAANRTAKKDGVSFSVIGDKTRDRCAELVYDALAMGSTAPNDQLKERAVRIEANTYREHGSTSAEYKARMRSLFSNLKDKNNPSLRENVVSGDLSVDKFTKMSTQDMASAERKAENARIADANMFASLGAGEPEAETDAFQCGKCKQRKTRYRQAQTRSADEPMTTFVTCVNCGNKWKFS